MDGPLVLQSFHKLDIQFKDLNIVIQPGQVPLPLQEGLGLLKLQILLLDFSLQLDDLASKVLQLAHPGLVGRLLSKRLLNLGKQELESGTPAAFAISAYCCFFSSEDV